MKLSRLSENQKNILSELEREVGFSLEKDMEEHKFLIMDWKWGIRVNDFELYNKFAEKFGEKVAEGKYSIKSFTYELPARGPYNCWFNF